MTFNDLFKSSFLENITGFSALDAIIAMGLTFTLGLFIFFVYKKTYTGVMYSTGFGVSLLGLTLVTTLIILAVMSNIILSLGTVARCPLSGSEQQLKNLLILCFCSGPLQQALYWEQGFCRLQFSAPCSLALYSVCSSIKKAWIRPTS